MLDLSKGTEELREKAASVLARVVVKGHLKSLNISDGLEEIMKLITSRDQQIALVAQIKENELAYRNSLTISSADQISRSLASRGRALKQEQEKST